MHVTIDGVTYVPFQRPTKKVTWSTLGGYLNFLRTNTHQTLDCVAMATLVSKSNIWELENDRTMPSLKMATILCDYYGGDIAIMAQLSRHHVKKS